MQRTTIMLPPDLKNAAQRQAQQRGISLGELIRESLERSLGPTAGRRANDPLFADTACFNEDTEPDLAADHDRYLYDEEAR